MIINVLEILQLDGPEEGQVLYWALGLLATGLGAALIYVKQLHKTQIEAKDTVISEQTKTINYERSEKEKWQEKYTDIVVEFNSIFENANIALQRRKNG